MPMALLATQGVFYGLIGNPMGPIARWRAALVRPAPRQSAPGAMVGQVCALGAVPGDFSALCAVFSYFECAGRRLQLFSVRLAPPLVCLHVGAASAKWRNVLIIK